MTSFAATEDVDSFLTDYDDVAMFVKYPLLYPVRDRGDCANVSAMFYLSTLHVAPTFGILYAHLLV